MKPIRPAVGEAIVNLRAHVLWKHIQNTGYDASKEQVMALVRKMPDHEVKAELLRIPILQTPLSWLTRLFGKW